MRQPASRLLQERSEDVECAREIGSPMHHDKNGMALISPFVDGNSSIGVYS